MLEVRDVGCPGSEEEVMMDVEYQEEVMEATGDEVTMSVLAGVEVLHEMAEVLDFHLACLVVFRDLYKIINMSCSITHTHTFM